LRRCIASTAAVDCAGETAAGLLLQMLYSVRSERLLMEQNGIQTYCSAGVGLNVDEEVWDVTVFTKKPRAIAERRNLRDIF